MLKSLKAGTKPSSEVRNGAELPPNKSLTSSRKSTIIPPVFKRQFFISEMRDAQAPSPVFLKDLGPTRTPNLSSQLLQCCFSFYWALEWWLHNTALVSTPNWAKTQTNVLSCEGKEGGGVRQKLIIKQSVKIQGGETILHHCSGLCRCFFKPFSVLVFPNTPSHSAGGRFTQLADGSFSTSPRAAPN